VLLNSSTKCFTTGTGTNFPTGAINFIFVLSRIFGVVQYFLCDILSTIFFLFFFWQLHCLQNTAVDITFDILNIFVRNNPGYSTHMVVLKDLCFIDLYYFGTYYNSILYPEHPFTLCKHIGSTPSFGGDRVANRFIFCMLCCVLFDCLRLVSCVTDVVSVNIVHLDCLVGFL